MSGSGEEEKGRFGGVRVLIFDLDGTLIDSKLDLAISVNATRRHMGLDPLADETIFGYVGNGAQVLVQRALGEGVTLEEIEKGHKFFLAYYRAHMLDNTVAYPGVREALEMLKERDLAVLTNKPVRFSQAILDGLGLARYFQYVYGGNSFATKKPDPEGVRTLLRDFGAAPGEAMMVGDSEVDVRTARNSGTWACGVTYGLGLDGMRAHPPDLMLDSLADLPRHLDAIEAPERTE
ncbi:MAG TPA: HAD-IA family hydrolase [Candidatus Baltobacteraceae bacterium]|nr:HAD-IA family hydrolase [Candidatus Baltobacteraceae bacterium]